MNFTRFPANTTNVFPIANSMTGGQLLTEFNLISRESVLTSDKVEYFIGQSFVHSLSDLSVRILQDELGNTISSTVLEITPGRAVVNGHYFESVSNVTIDMAEANIELESYDQEPLKGRLAIGLRAMYSTEQTLAASLRTVNGVNMLEGIQVVILPIGKVEHGYFVLPEDSPDDENYVTAHIKLAEFYYLNGSIRSIVQNEEKIQYIPASRVGDFESLLAKTYVTRRGLNPKKLYTFSGKSNDPNSSKDTWCDSTDALFIWQKASDLKTTTDIQLKQAEFGINDKEKVTLTLPHKEVDGGMFNTDGKQVYYTPRVMELPQASYAKNTPGTITSDYTRSVKSIKEDLANFYHMSSGKQRGYVDTITDEKREELPTLNQSWDVGDYILVSKDGSLGNSESTASQSPSSIYVVLPPIVKSVKYLTTVKGSEEIPAALTGVEISKIVNQYNGENDDAETIATNLAYLTEDYDTYNKELGIEDSKYRGTKPVDYVVVKYENIPVSTGVKQTWYFYYSVDTYVDGLKTYSDPVPLTGNITLATVDGIGGFLNVTDTDKDYGYVYRDESGHLVLLDYTLLRSGVLAYQLGQDYEFGNGLSTSEIQKQLDEYVNDRVAFPTEEQVQKAKYPNMLELTLSLSEEDSYEILNVKDIDSRFGTGINLHILGTATSTTTVNIINCEKIRIATIEGNPIVNVYNSNLYYDAEIIEHINTCGRVREHDNYDITYGGDIYPSNFTGIENLKLWYEKFEDDDPNLIVDGLTVTETDTPIIPEDYDFWSESVVNDSHFYYGLQSLTFAPNGRLAGCGLYMRNDLSANIDLTTTLAVAQFTLPQGAYFTYPLSSLVAPIKITGDFVTAYPNSDPTGFITMTTNFTAVTQSYGNYSEVSGYSDIGTISFLTKSELVENYIGIDANTAIDGWEPNSYHVFKGWTIG